VTNAFSSETLRAGNLARSIEAQLMLYFTKKQLLDTKALQVSEQASDHRLRGSAPAQNNSETSFRANSAT